MMASVSWARVRSDVKAWSKRAPWAFSSSPARLASARDRVEDPAIASDAAALQAALVELDQAQEENDVLYARWAELTEKGV